uniref:hypothetical protein n=1 Tax=uncultured Erythrobacter sp. TaxID=263913 RepID=UPI0026102408|nr:hypothetical protein [uncultured Erythrobacter sp.]
MDWIKLAGVRILMLVGCIFVMHYLHEFGHAFAAKSLGYDVELTINKVISAASRETAPLLHLILIAAGGPLVTMILSVLAYLARSRLGMLAPIIIFNALAMRVIAAIISISNPNDEAWISSALGLGTWTVPALVCVFLSAIFVLIARENRLRIGWYLAMWIGISIGYTSVVMGENAFPQFAF